ncbi:MAG: thymidine phosphorylase [Candidatus Eisenbacteria bacterium]
MADDFDARGFIRTKRDGARHAPGAVRDFVRAYTAGDVPDYQVAAWLMAVFLRGLADEETFELTDAMLHSGEVIAFEGLPSPTVDKHSTGGVGDKISLPLAPLVAACGACVPMISGRGLGHTGGTLDKLEAIPGFDPKLSVADFKRLVRSLGFAFGGQTAQLAPADGKLYALRDVTATVECIPLIIASILSKKYASGTEAVVFDVKTGRGAFMRERADAKRLAEGLIAVSQRMGKRATALVTNMDQPLGFAIGNALEVVESIDVLKGTGPADVRELTLELAAEMLALAGVAKDRKDARARAEGALASGAALEKFRAIVEAQGGDPAVIDDPARLPRAPRVVAVLAPGAGFVHAIDSYALGELVVGMGGGRARKEDTIDPAVGIVLAKKTGDRVEAGEELARLHLGSAQNPAFESAVANAFRIEPKAPAAALLVIERLTA